MTTIEKGVKEVISQNSRFTVTEIKSSDRIDKFISSFMADRLAREIKRKFSNIDSTFLTNELFTNIKTVAELISHISKYYI